MTPIIRDYRAGDLRKVWGCLAANDLRELALANITDPDAVELDNAKEGAHLRTVEAPNGAVLAVYGAIPSHAYNTAVVWALPSTDAKKHWRWFVRATEAMLQELAASVDRAVLYNYKDADQEAHIAWLKRIGFTVTRPKIELKSPVVLIERTFT